MTSSAVNWLADVMISKDKSEWEEILLYYRAMGFSEEESFLAALKERGWQMNFCKLHEIMLMKA